MKNNLPKLKDHCILCNLGGKIIKGDLSIKKITKGLQLFCTIFALIANGFLFIKALQAYLHMDED